MDMKKLLEQIDEWYDSDEHQKIIDTILAIPKEQCDYFLTGQVAVAYNNIGNYDEAKKTLFSVEKEGKTDYKWYYRLGYACYFSSEKEKDFEETKSYFEKSNELSGDNDEDIIDFIDKCTRKLNYFKEYKLKQATFVARNNGNDEALSRKAHSIEILKEQNVPFVEHMPVIEKRDKVKIRTKDDIAKRVIASLLTIQFACDLAGNNEDSDIEESKEFFQELLHKYNVSEYLTSAEKEIFNGKPAEQAVINMIWKYEAYWVLLWSLGLVATLSYPSEACDCDFAVDAVYQCASYEDFMRTANFRSIDEILDEADLIYRYDWACVDARINKREAPANLNSSVVLERHKALNWLIDYDKDDDWDNVSTNTKFISISTDIYDKKIFLIS